MSSRSGGPDEGTSDPTVTVIVPAHDVAEYVGEALDSVLAQTFTDYEVVVVDDGSTDDTAAIVQMYVDKYSGRIRLLTQPQSGASRARNRGIEEARGSLIAFLDADDLWLPEKLHKQVEAYRANPDLGLVTCLHESFSPEHVDRYGHRKGEYLFGRDNICAALVVNSNMATPTVMVPRWVLDNVGVFDEDLAIAEDDNLWIRIMARHPAHLVDDLLVRCRMRPGSLSSDHEMLFDDVSTSLDRLMEEDGVIRRQIRNAVPRRKSVVAWSRGYHAFDRGEPGVARRSFVEAIRHDWTNRPAWTFLAATLVPPPILRSLRSIRRRLKGTGRGATTSR